MTTMEMAPLRRVMMHPMAASPSLLFATPYVRACSGLLGGESTGGWGAICSADGLGYRSESAGDREAESEEARTRHATIR
jgi:hypothetical protein